jgi:hypothetical protein
MAQMVAQSGGEVISESIHVYVRVRPKLNATSQLSPVALDDSHDDDEYDDEDLVGSAKNLRSSFPSITSFDKDGICVYGMEDQGGSGGGTSNNNVGGSNSNISSCSSSGGGNARRPQASSQFKFDSCLGADSSQEEVYLQCAKPIVDSALRGYSGTILAYGPTGSGKTFTMRGGDAPQDRGVIPRCMEQILNETHGAVEVRVSYLQIYCESVGDLLNPEMSHLSIRERSGGTVYVENISSARITSLEDLHAMMTKGDANRSTAATLKNATSSRSHAALIVNLSIPDEEARGVDQGKSECVSCKEASLVLVDLAGSERHDASAGRHLRLEEAKSINLSLSALGNCMSALAEARSHVPYRDSKLTRLLQGSLGGGSRTSVIINLAPDPDSTGECLNALRFASRASKVKVVSKVARFVDYEVLYRAAQKELDGAQERLLENEKVLETAEARAEREEGRAADLQQQVVILRQMLQMQESQQKVRGEAGADAGTAPGDGGEHSAGKDSKEDEAKEQEQEQAADAAAEWQQEMRTMAEKHMGDLAAVRVEWAGKVTRARDDAKSFKTVIAKEQDALQAERENHLATLQQLNACRAQLREEDAARSTSMGEKMAELDDRRRDMEALERSIRAEKEEVEAMKLTMSTMVSKSQLSDMEKLFTDTVGMLTARLETMEPMHRQGQSQGGGAGGDDDDEWSLGSPRDPAPMRPRQPTEMVPNSNRRPAYQSGAGGGGSKAGARIEIGRVRQPGGSKW